MGESLIADGARAAGSQGSALALPALSPGGDRESARPGPRKREWREDDSDAVRYITHEHRE